MHVLKRGREGRPELAERVVRRKVQLPIGGGVVGSFGVKIAANRQNFRRRGQPGSLAGQVRGHGGIAADADGHELVRERRRHCLGIHLFDFRVRFGGLGLRFVETDQLPAVGGRQRGADERERLNVAPPIGDRLGEELGDRLGFSRRPIGQGPLLVGRDFQRENAIAQLREGREQGRRHGRHFLRSVQFAQDEDIALAGQSAESSLGRNRQRVGLDVFRDGWLGNGLFRSNLLWNGLLRNDLSSRGRRREDQAQRTEEE